MRLTLSAALAASMAAAATAAENRRVGFNVGWNSTALSAYRRDSPPFLTVPTTTTAAATAVAALAVPAKRSVINCTGKKAVTDLLTTKAMFFFAYLAIFLTSISGNSLVVYIVLTTKNMQTVTNIFITNLAISDLLVCCTSLWLTPVYTYVGHWIWGGWLCYGLPLFQGTSIFISTLTLMSIAVDRYFVICRHSKSIVNINERMSMQVCIAIITLIWMMSLLLVMPYAVHMRMAYVQQPCDFWLCVEDWAMEDLKSLYGVIVLSLQFAVPFVIIGYSYVRIWFFLNQRRRKSRRTIFNSERESETETQRKRRLLRMLITMVVLFAICWFPFNLLNILRDLKMDAWLKPYFSFFFLSAHLISMTTTACNPILYAGMNHAFRNEFVRVVPLLGVICKRLSANSSAANSSEHNANGRRYGVMKRVVESDYGGSKRCSRCRAVSLESATFLQNGTVGDKKP